MKYLGNFIGRTEKRKKSRDRNRGAFGSELEIKTPPSSIITLRSEEQETKLIKLLPRGKNSAFKRKSK